MAFSGGRLLKSHEFEIARREHSKNMSQPKSEATKLKMRKPKSLEHAAKIKQHVIEQWKTRDRKEAASKMRVGIKEKYPDGLPGHPLSEETKERLRIANLGKKQSDVTRTKRREQTVGEGNPMHGKKHSEATRAKMKAAWELRRTKSEITQ